MHCIGRLRSRGQVLPLGVTAALTTYYVALGAGPPFLEGPQYACYICT